MSDDDNDYYEDDADDYEESELDEFNDIHPDLDVEIDTYEDGDDDADGDVDADGDAEADGDADGDDEDDSDEDDGQSDKKIKKSTNIIINAKRDVQKIVPKFYNTKDKLLRVSNTSVKRIVVNPNDRMTPHFLSDFEVAYILRKRIESIDNGDIVFITITPEMDTSEKIAIAELIARKNPFILEREIEVVNGNRIVEEWNVNEMALPSIERYLLS